MKRKNDREAKEIFENLSKALPNLPAPGELPPLPIPQANDAPQEIVLPKLDELPPLPAPGELPMPPAPGQPIPPAPGALPLLPGMPAPQKTVTCGSCGAKTIVKDMTLRRMDVGLLRSNQYVRPFCVWNFWIHWKSCSGTATC